MNAACSLSDRSPADRAALAARFWRLFGDAVPRAGAFRRCWLADTRAEPRFQYDAVHNVHAARVVFLLYNGDIPSGYSVRRTCRNVRCLRPDHIVVRKPSGRDRCAACREREKAVA
jgi:hypothetical protein